MEIDMINTHGHIRNLSNRIGQARYYISRQSIGVARNDAGSPGCQRY